MERSNTHITPLVVDTVTGILLIVGTAIVIASTVLFSRAQHSLEQLQTDSPLLSERLLRTTLHGAATVPVLIQQVQTAYLLVIGMVLILAGYMVYTAHIIHTRALRDEHSILHHIKQWFAACLDRAPRITHHWLVK